MDAKTSPRQPFLVEAAELQQSVIDAMQEWMARTDVDDGMSSIHLLFLIENLCERFLTVATQAECEQFKETLRHLEARRSDPRVEGHA